MSLDLLSRLKKYIHDEENSDLDSIYAECENAGLTAVVNDVIDTLLLGTSSCFDEDCLEKLFAICSHFADLSSSVRNKVYDLLTSNISSESAILEDMISANATDFTVPQTNLETTGIAFQLTVNSLSSSNQLSVIRSSTNTVKGRKKNPTTNSNWNGISHVNALLDAIITLFQKKLSRVWTTSSERDMFLSLFLKPIYTLMESEINIKNASFRSRLFNIIGLAVQFHNHTTAAETNIIQNLQYFEHLSEYAADLVHIVTVQFNSVTLAEGIIRTLCSLEFNDNDVKGPKQVALFLVRLSSLIPNLCLKQLTQLVKLLDSESYTLRCAIIEVLANVVIDQIHDEAQNEMSESVPATVQSLMDLLSERLLDISPYCRTKVLHVFIKIFDLPIKYPRKRQEIAELVIRCLQDRSSHVRRNAIKLFSKLLTTHPFSVMHNGLLTRNIWEKGLSIIEEQLNSLQPKQQEKVVDSELEVDENLLEDATMIQDDESHEGESHLENSLSEYVDSVPAEEIVKVNLTKRFYLEALQYIDIVEAGAKIISQLLFAKNKSEVIESMDFFVFCNSFGISSSKLYIKKMIHLIWVKGTSDEGNNIQNHVLSCYKTLFFEPPPNSGTNEAANYIARNLISLTYDASLAELTSLEQMLCILMKDGYFSHLVITKLWQVYSYQKKDISRTQRRGSIIVIGMLALGNTDVVMQGLDHLIQIGLGPPGLEDLVLARYTCIAIKRIGKDASGSSNINFPNSHTLCQKLCMLLLRPSFSEEWFGLEEQAIEAIYAVAKHPDELCTNIILLLTKQLFKPSNHENTTSNDDHAMDEDLDDSPEEETLKDEEEIGIRLAHLIFLVGHVAIKQLVYIEYCEAEFKRRKADAERLAVQNSNNPINGQETSEYDLITGTSEDDFSEAMTFIRERELLYGENSLLSRFAPLVVELCSNHKSHNNQSLLLAASLTLSKFMCLSNNFCMEHLPLLITILEKCDNPIIRNNLVIGLADLTVCFNHFIDEISEYLYRRLMDEESSVKKTCFMTLAFLILAGQIKVKGQLGIMARSLEDEDARISDLARMFFTDFAAKDNSVYNNFIDIFSVLSRSAEEQDEDDAKFKRIIRFLTSFIEKERHTKQLAERLAARLDRCKTQRQWDHVVYALSLLPHKADNIQKLIDDGYHE
ncbi:condensin complex non-SMC subunit Cnd1 [Schizosaccharomyces pombe]|uniref:Condensin complex subunit 1 n=1 Tax=Schizosaccharomyces pombe (strain 972 / ATCC 24843) TaxID=284812 RepID=CND1_SCHPO|nr:condensin complex non-SMC subunit Cnd1 [Schizosaccharomyces pombe]O94679.1 RecName: Full=Condensin complex subunit 1; AltName: Full=XCAP-D2 homolog; AltName: Full=p128 [Schizosaccharomyces pombe 972h-]BAA82624.1 subunit of condensin complex [Schizosaccharomyces pombe]CAA22886.1 condensin complex non-SMC subunit Cnd1 [Schizosaccharomyces pombe]|eukprot:NP_596329.1 condensin complex non-SMC subunit Cnd1 [Schizosaccharomyces pombe]